MALKTAKKSSQHATAAPPSLTPTPPRALATVLSVIVVCSCGLAPQPQTALTAAPSGTYRLDPAHASVVFAVEHAGGLSKFVARFDDVDAGLTFDANNPQAARLEAIITADSLSTGMADFDQQLANHARVLDAKRHPTLIFTSTGIALTGQNTAEITGDFTLRGETHPITLDAVFNGSTRDILRGNRQVLGFSATTSIDRSQWGADAYVNFGVGNAVEVWIEAEFVRQ